MMVINQKDFVGVCGARVEDSPQTRTHFVVNNYKLIVQHSLSYLSHAFKPLRLYNKNIKQFSN